MCCKKLRDKNRSKKLKIYATLGLIQTNVEAIKNYSEPIAEPANEKRHFGISAMILNLSGSEIFHLSRPNPPMAR
jgi:hypothetical protein